MGIWKLGYINDLDDVISWDIGKALYDVFGGTPLTLDSTKMCRAVGRVVSLYTSYGIYCTDIINYPNIANDTFEQAETDAEFEIDEFNRGFIRFLSGTLKNNVYKITDTGLTTLVTSTHLGAAGVSSGDYFEVVTGSCTFEFPTNRNPTNRVFKRAVTNKANRFPFSQGGLTMFEGYQPDDFVVMAYLTADEDTDRLEVMLNHALDYKGFDGPYSYDTISGSDDGLAPMILECGNNTVENQYVVYMNDYKIIKDAKYNDKFSEVMIHFVNYSSVIYRGV